MNIQLLLFLLCSNLLADPINKGGEVGDKFLKNSPNLFLTGSGIKQIIDTHGKPNYKSKGSIIYMLNKELHLVEGIVIFYLDENENVKYAETVTKEGEILESTYKYWRKFLQLQKEKKNEKITKPNP
jgi:hypothetical protein